MIKKIAKSKRVNSDLDHYHICEGCGFESTPEDCAYYDAKDCIDSLCQECQRE